jgi:hypothetical protein
VADGSQQGWHLAPASAPALQPITNWSDPGAAAAKTALLGQQPPQGDTGGGQVNQAMSIPTPTGVSSSGSPYYMPSYTYSPEGTQAPVGAYNYTATDQGHTQVYPPGQVAPSDQAQVSWQLRPLARAARCLRRRSTRPTTIRPTPTLSR